MTTPGTHDEVLKMIVSKFPHRVIFSKAWYLYGSTYFGQELSIEHSCIFRKSCLCTSNKVLLQFPFSCAYVRDII